MKIEKPKPLFRGKLPLSVLFGILINLLTFSNSFAEAPNDTKLLFLGNKNIAPIIYLNKNTPSGVAVDITRALSKHIPQPVEIKAMDWLEAQALVARGEADALIQINQNEERKKIYDFSDTLLESQFSIFTRSNKMGISALSNLRDLRVGVESGGLPQQVLEKSMHIPLTIIPNFIEGFKMLDEASIDAVVVDYRVGSYILAENNIRNIKVTGEPIALSYSSFAVKKGNTKLLNAINNALQIIKADGTYNNIIDNWKPKDAVFQTQEQIAQQITHVIYYIAIIILLIFFIIAVIWTQTLKKELAKRKTAEEQILKLNLIYAVLSNINQAIVRIHEPGELLNEACRIAIEYGKFRMAWIGMVNLQTNKVDVAASNGVSGDYLDKINIDLNDEARSNGPAGTAVKTGKHKISNNIKHDDSMIPWRDNAVKYDYKSIAAFPLIVFDKVVGAFTIYSNETDFFDEEDIKLLDEMAKDISFALEFIESEAERKKAEEDRLAHLRFFKSMDKINRAIQGTPDLEQMMSDVLSAVFSIFDCDRVWLFYPCDPDAPAFRVPMEITRPKYPGAKVLNVDVPMFQDMAQDLRGALASDDPVVCIAGTENPINKLSAEQFGVLSQMYAALYPRLGKPWVFGMHQCSYPRVWTEEEQKLFKEIGRRLADALTSLLMLRDLKESEDKYRTLIQKIQAAVVVYGADTKILTSNSMAQELLGLTEEQMQGKLAVNPDCHFFRDDGTVMPFEEYPVNRVLATRQALSNLIVGVHRPDKENDVWALVNADPVFDKEDEIAQVIVTFADITKLKQADEMIVKSLREKETLIRELYHRTKNTMQVIRGILVLQALKFPANIELQQLVKNTEERIQAISLVHQMLYKSKDLSQISIKEYLHELSALIMKGFGVSADRISLNTKINDQYFLLDTAIPFGLIINELMANSLKYAFPDNRKGMISISLTEGESKNIILQYSDDGVGVPDGFDFRNQNTLGLKLIYNIGESQMMGKVVMENNNGVSCSVEFSNKFYKARV